MKPRNIPYGTWSEGPEEARYAYYYYGHKNDGDWPELPVVPPPPCPWYDNTGIDRQIAAVKLVAMLEEKLTPREWKILIYRFKMSMTYEEIGRMFDISTKRVRQIEMKARRRSRKYFVGLKR